MRLNFFYLFNFYVQAIKERVESDIYLGKPISISALRKDIKHKSQNEIDKISKEYFIQKYKYIKAVKYEINRMLRSKCYDNNLIKLNLRNILNIELLNKIKKDVNWIESKINEHLNITLN